MNIPLAIFGAVIICIGVTFVKTSMNSYKNGVKDTFGSIIWSLVGGIGLIIIGIVIIIKAFTL